MDEEVEETTFMTPPTKPIKLTASSFTTQTPFALQASLTPERELLVQASKSEERREGLYRGTNRVQP